MRELRVLTLHVDPSTGLFDDGPLQGYLAGRELVRCEPAFFVHEGRPGWSVFLETRLVPEARERAVAPAQGAARGPGSARSSKALDAARRQGEREAFAALLRELDPEQRQRYERLRSWRRAVADSRGVPAYVILTNAQMLELARTRPATLEALASVHGVGAKRVKRHGKAILEVLGVSVTKAGPEGGPRLRAVDGADQMVAGAKQPLPEAPAP